MNFEIISKPEKPFEEFESKFAGKKEVTLEDLREMKENGISTEDFLNFLVKKRGLLLHGSRSEIGSDQKLNPNHIGESFLTNNSAIAILKGIFSNRGEGLNLDYPYIIDEENPLKLMIENSNSETIGEGGFVYVVQDYEGFENDPPESWQFARRNSKESLKFIQRFEIERNDFKYPVEEGK